jgi:hypothetical protein
MYQSSDLDFVLQTAISQARLDSAMATAEFSRQGNQYVHPRASFFVEFPAGPLAIGSDFRIEPVERRVGRSLVTALSATDSCRDRLAAFYFWNDRQSLRTAVQIAVRQRVRLETIRKWSRVEGFQAPFEEFVAELSRARRRRRRKGASGTRRNQE